MTTLTVSDKGKINCETVAFCISLWGNENALGIMKMTEVAQLSGSLNIPLKTHLSYLVLCMCCCAPAPVLARLNLLYNSQPGGVCQQRCEPSHHPKLKVL